MHAHLAFSFRLICWPIRPPGSCPFLPPHIRPSPLLLQPRRLALLSLFLENHQACSSLRAFVLHYFQLTGHWSPRSLCSCRLLILHLGAQRLLSSERPPLTTNLNKVAPIRHIFKNVLPSAFYDDFFPPGEHFISQKGCQARFRSVSGPLWILQDLQRWLASLFTYQTPRGGGRGRGGGTVLGTWSC